MSNYLEIAERWPMVNAYYIIDAVNHWNRERREDNLPLVSNEQVEFLFRRCDETGSNDINPFIDEYKILLKKDLIKELISE